MALGRELPKSFDEATRLAARILSSNAELVRKNVVQTEAEQIVQAAYRKTMGKALSRSEVLSRARDRFPEAGGEAVIVMATGRAEGKLLQHLTGYQTFLNHDYQVGPDVLVPRPETEILVRAAIESLDPSISTGLEIGIGSGAISIELLSVFPTLKMTATELSPAAKTLAQANATRNLKGPSRLQVLDAKAGQVFEPFHNAGISRADFLISNPPYLDRDTEADAEVLRWEPLEALFAPKGDALYFYRAIARGVATHLLPGGKIFVEIPHERARAIAELFEKNGWTARLLEDLSGRERVMIAEARNG